MAWNIEDFEGTRRCIRTKAYYVPEASVRLFSPQVYIGNDDTAKLVLDKNGTHFTLTDGTVLHFPVGKGNNLPFMLTEATISSNIKKFKRAATRPLAQLVLSQFKLAIKRQYEPIIKNAPVIFTSSKIDTYSLSTAQALPSLTERSIFSKDNWNLTNAQKELLLWHCRWNHCGMQ